MGLGGSIASTVKNKISGYGGNLVSNAAGAAKSPKRTGSVNHDVEGLIEKNQFLDNNNVVYYPLDVGTEANGHYLQFFIRKQANLKMTFKGNDGKELVAEENNTKVIKKYYLKESEDRPTTNIRKLIYGIKYKKELLKKDGDDDNDYSDKYIIPKLENDEKFIGRTTESDGKEYLIYVKGTIANAYTKKKGFYRNKELKWEWVNAYKPPKKKWQFKKKSVSEPKPKEKDKEWTIAWVVNYKLDSYPVTVEDVRNEDGKTKGLGVGETPENEVKVGITNKYPTLRMESSIALFLPNSIKNETKPEWGETGTRLSYEAQATLTAVGGDLAGGVSGGGHAAMMMMKEKLIPNLMDRAGAKYGMAYTDRMQVFFKNMGKRSFSYNFKFMPKSAKESERVDDIVKMFRFYGSPSYLNSKTVQGNNEGMGTGGTERGQSGGWSVMRQPQIFEIVYMYKDKRNEYLNRISHCVLDSFSVTYNGDNNKFFNPSGDKKSGSPAPVETQIDLTFKEIEIITKDKIDQGF